MTTLQGTIKDSASNPLTGNLVVELAGVMVDNTTTPPSVLTPEPFTFYIENGTVSVDIPESETEQNSYRFRFYVETAPDEFDDNPEFDFYAQIPNLATVDLVNLIPTGMVNDVMATGALRIAKLIINDPNLSTKVGGVFPEGDWDSETEYKRGSIVKYLNRAYIAAIDSPAGALPTDTIYWMNLPTEPDGSLLLGDATPYGVSWNGSGLAASQDAIYDQIESVKSTVNTKANINNPTLTGTVTLPSTTSIGNVSSTEISYLDGVSSSIQTQLDTKASLASPALTGTPTATTASLGDSSLRIATTAFVANELAPVNSSITTLDTVKAPLASPALTGVPTAPTAAIGTNTTQIATTAFVQQAIPIGSIHFFPSTTAPSGYLKLEGQLLNRTTYAALWAYIQASGNLVTDANWSSNNKGAFSSGDGSSTFRLPDYRGQFLRIFDPTNSIDTDRTALGQTQGDAIRNITGTIDGVSETFGSGGSIVTGVFEKSPEQTNVGGTPTSTDSGSDAGFLTFDASNVVPVANENRPKNIAMVACIYAGA